MMRLLADENCDRLLIATLRDAGHDVAYVLENNKGIDDSMVFRLAELQGRILLTDDLDFGHLAELERNRSPAIILMRLDPLGRMARIARATEALGSLGDTATGQLIVVEPGQTRIRALNRV